MSITVVILTKNEQCHIARAIQSVKSLADRIIIVDSGSVDNTVKIARSLGADILVNPFVTQAKQFNWALDQLSNDTEWVFRLDADEVVSFELAQSLITILPVLGSDVAGASIHRRMAFLGKPIIWGGVFPVEVTRVLRYGRGRSEDRWMDEHILLDGPEVLLKGELLDDNLKSLSWWIDKHNNYASREVIEILDFDYGFLKRENIGKPEGMAGVKRWFKEVVYSRLPRGLRSLAYFIYRYVLRLGFLDGMKGSAFHILQGFWYRYLVDLKLYEVELYMRVHDVDVLTAIKEVLGVALKESELDS